MREDRRAATATTWQAQAAEDESVRAAMAIIARDETRHGALAWRVARWIEPLLSPAERGQIDEARAAEIAALARHASTSAPAPELVRAAGLPEPARATTFVRRLEETLWNVSFAAEVRSA